MPDRFPAAKLVRHQRRGRSAARSPGDAGGRHSVWSAAKPGLIQLFDPPFDRSDLNPGYIKGYVPGVRENGGQYTHAAIWTVMAFALLGDNDRAWELVALLNPINHAATPAADRPLTKSSLMSLRRTSTPLRRIPVAAAGPGTPVRPVGCIGS